MALSKPTDIDRLKLSIDNTREEEPTISIQFITESPVSSRLTQIVLKNDGNPFESNDWNRLISIAEGNPGT
ncbi:hypothetical protein BC936DRAFT_144484 [Jimgerdemannia flammicorona]|uniref:Uncharacterized protein n=1 Tax=Jimgerdemannia flammicorona TaxID=994334 RepID=A0A433DCD9_9FUNG|nr:hypothetical protein BC936DRAFT_144484 [Jimgerdemannia flammicorona]